MEKNQAKKIFMNKLDNYLGNQTRNQAGYEIGVSALDGLPKKVTQIETPFFLMKRKKSVPRPMPMNKKDPKPEINQMSFAKLKMGSQSPSRADNTPKHYDSAMQPWSPKSSQTQSKKLVPPLN